MSIPTVPSVGGTKGIFELFVPGLFLLLNLLGVAYYAPRVGTHAVAAVQSSNQNPVATAAVVICFSYLLGVLLRLPQVERADELSARFLRRFHRAARLNKEATVDGSTMADQTTDDENDGYALWASDYFPYIRFLGTLCKNRLTPEALRFYEVAWKPYVQRGRVKHSKQFVNMCRMLIACIDPVVAAELYANESMCRYISGMFYSLVVVTPLIAAVWTYRLLTHQPFPLAALLLLYVPAILLILWNLRFMRIKESEALFAACLGHRDRLEPVLTREDVAHELPTGCME